MIVLAYSKGIDISNEFKQTVSNHRYSSILPCNSVEQIFRSCKILSTKIRRITP